MREKLAKVPPDILELSPIKRAACLAGYVIDATEMLDLTLDHSLMALGLAVHGLIEQRGGTMVDLEVFLARVRSVHQRLTEQGAGLKSHQAGSVH